MQVRKSAPRTFWRDGLAGAEDCKVFHPDPNGEVRGRADFAEVTEELGWALE